MNQCTCCILPYVNVITEDLVSILCQINMWNLKGASISFLSEHAKYVSSLKLVFNKKVKIKDDRIIVFYWGLQYSFLQSNQLQNLH